MKNQASLLTISLILFIGYSLTACSDTPPTEQAASTAAKNQEKSSPSTDVVEKSKVLWEQTKDTTGTVVDKSVEMGTSAVEKSKELYSDGKDQGAKLIDKSKEAWEQSKKTTGDAIEKGKEMGTQAMEKAGDVSKDISDKARQLYDDATKEEPKVPAGVKEL